MKKLLALLLCILLVCSMVACSEDTPSTEPDTQTDDTSETEDTGKTEDTGDDGIVIALMMKSLTSEWNQNIEESLEQLMSNVASLDDVIKFEILAG